MFPEAPLALLRHPMRTRSAAWFCRLPTDHPIVSRKPNCNKKHRIKRVKNQIYDFYLNFSRYLLFDKPVTPHTYMKRIEHGSFGAHAFDLYCYSLGINKGLCHGHITSRSNYTTIPMISHAERRFQNSTRAQSLPDLRRNSLLEYIERSTRLWNTIIYDVQPMRYSSTFVRFGERLSKVLRSTYTNIKNLNYTFQTRALGLRGINLSRDIWKNRASDFRERWIPFRRVVEEPEMIESHTIRANMTITEITSILKRHCRENLGRLLPLNFCSRYPVATGGFGDIYLGKLDNGTPVAVKVARYMTHGVCSGKQTKYAAKELHTWAKCQHPNILPLLGMVEFQNQIAMVSPWMKYGDLRGYLKQNPEADRCQLSYEICDGLVYLHNMNIVHGDLKGANVLVSESGNAMLSDFGNSLIEGKTVGFTATTRSTAYSSRWAAPEILEGAPVSYQADVFALGMTLLEAITGDVPYRELESDRAVIVAILVKRVTPVRPTVHISHRSAHGDLLWKLLTRCWEYEPGIRPRAEEARDMMLQVTKTGLLQQL